MKLLTALLLLVSFGFSGACAQNFIDDGAQREIASYAALGFSLVVLLVALAYMAGSTTSNAGLLMFAKDELFHLFMSAVLVVSIGAIMYFSCTVVTAFLDFSLNSLVGTDGMCYSGTESPTDVARCYVARLEGSASGMLSYMIRDSIGNEMNSAYVLGLYNPVSGGIMTPTKAYLKTHAMQLDLIELTFVLPALTSLTVQKIFLNFAADLVKYLIPVALFFRILPGLRPMGNLLIALVIALYVFVPAIYALNAAMDDAVFRNGVMGCGGMEGFIGDRVMGNCESVYNFWAVARLIPQAFFLPNLAIAITITFLSAVNKALKVIT